MLKPAGEDTRSISLRNIAFITAIAIGVIASLVALIQWELGRECVRWSTRIDVTESGGINRTQVCVEFRQRQYGEEPPFDWRSPKAK